MDLETKRFLRRRKLEAILPWIGILGVIVLVFSLLFGGIPIFLTEIGFIANFYYWIDEYNWIAERITSAKDYLSDKEKKKQTKIVLILMSIITISSTVILIYLRKQQMFSFILGLGVISSNYFISRVIENTFWIFKVKFSSFKKYYLILFGITIIGASSMTFVMYHNQVAYLTILIIIGIIYVVEVDIIAEIRKRSSRNQAGQNNRIKLDE